MSALQRGVLSKGLPPKGMAGYVNFFPLYIYVYIDKNVSRNDQLIMAS